MDKENKKKAMNPTFDEILDLDQSLRYLAAYEVTGGYLLTPKTTEDMNEYTLNVANKFNYFKRLIHKGECTFDFIKRSVLTKNGPFHQKQENIDLDDPLCFEKLEQKENSIQDSSLAIIEKMLGSLFPGALIKKVDMGSDATMPNPSTEQKIPKTSKQSIKKNSKKRKKS